MKKKVYISTNQLLKATAQSSRMEGVNFESAKKNKSLIKMLQTHGRAFAISRQR